MQNSPKFSHCLTSQSQHHHLYGVTNGMTEMSALWPVPTAQEWEGCPCLCPPFLLGLRAPPSSKVQVLFTAFGVFRDPRVPCLHAHSLRSANLTPPKANPTRRIPSWDNHLSTEPPNAARLREPHHQFHRNKHTDNIINVV